MNQDVAYREFRVRVFCMLYPVSNCENLCSPLHNVSGNIWKDKMSFKNSCLLVSILMVKQCYHTFVTHLRAFNWNTYINYRQFAMKKIIIAWRQKRNIELQSEWLKIWLFSVTRHKKRMPCAISLKAHNTNALISLWLHFKSILLHFSSFRNSILRFQSNVMCE